MTVRWRERNLDGMEPKDTGSTGGDDTAVDTAEGDSGTTKDDSGTDDNGDPPWSEGFDEDDEATGGCACASGGTPATALLLLLGLPLVLRRRR